MVIRAPDGSLTVRKLPSTPHDPSQSVLTGIAERAARRADWRNVSRGAWHDGCHQRAAAAAGRENGPDYHARLPGRAGYRQADPNAVVHVSSHQAHCPCLNAACALNCGNGWTGRARPDSLRRSGNKRVAGRVESAGSASRWRSASSFRTSTPSMSVWWNGWRANADLTFLCHATFLPNPANTSVPARLPPMRLSRPSWRVIWAICKRRLQETGARRAARDAVGWRGVVGAGSVAPRHCHRAFGTGGRRGGGSAHRGGSGFSRSAYLRYGRHKHRCSAHS